MRTNPTTYKSTLMQKLLGRHYKWWYIFLHGLKANSAYAVADVFWFFGSLASVFGTIYLWIYTNNLFALENSIISLLIYSFISVNLCYQIDELISSGKISAYLIRPTNIITHFIFYLIGLNFRGLLLMSSISFTLIFVLLKNFNTFNFLTVLLYLIIGFMMRIYLDFIVGSLTFWVKNGYGTINFYLNVFTLLSGMLFPLAYYNNSIFLYTPFAFMVYQPAQIYLGNYTPLQIVYVFAGGILWALILSTLAHIIFKMGLKRNEAVGL